MIRENAMTLIKTPARVLAMGFAATLLCTSALAAQPDPAVAAQSGDKVEMKYSAADSETPVRGAIRVSSACTVRLLPTEDLRQNKETVGQSMGGALLAPGVDLWMDEGLHQLKAFGLTVIDAKPDAPAAEDGITLRTSLTRAYTWTIGLKLFSMVAVKAEFTDRNGVLQQKYYRSHGDKTNMWGANSEYVTTLNYGLNNMLPFMAQDLQSLCKGEKVAAYSYAGPEGPLPK
jgi:hypothetical protein